MHLKIFRYGIWGLKLSDSGFCVSASKCAGKCRAKQKSGCVNCAQPDFEFSCHFMLTFFVVVFFITVSENAFFSSFTSIFSK